jgi:uncharacterized protein
MRFINTAPDDHGAKSALLSFTTANVRSYRDETQLALIASRLARPEIVQHLRWGAGERTVRVLPAAGVFGANASGKSTILRAMGDMRELVLGSFRQGTASTVIQRKPFQLDSQSAEQPTRFAPPILLNPMTPATEF